MSQEIDEYVCTVLGRLAGCDSTTVSELTKSAGSLGESVLNSLVRRGIVSRVAARAVLLAYRNELDETDLRQLLQVGALRAELQRRANDTIVGRADAAPRTAPVQHFRLGDRVGKFLVKGMLGGGATGQVYLATHGTLGVPVALKVFAPPGGTESRFVRQFRDEARVLARLDHPNIVRVLDLEEGPPPYMVLEYIDGDSLEHTLGDGVPFERERAFRIAIQIARALRAAYRVRVIHLDVKPSNVLMTLNGGVKLADFGIARWQRGPMVRELAADGDPITIQGTLMYMAPEQFDNAPTFRSDVYALGLILYRMLAGASPVVGNTATEIAAWHRTGVAEPLHRFVAGVDVTVANFVQRLIDKSPERRPDSYEEVIAGMESAFGLKLDPV